jgi:protein-disulfide isomerase
MSKKEDLRRQKQSTERRNRILVVAGILVIVVLVVVIIVTSQINTAVKVVSVTPNPHPQVNGMTMGDPNAPVKMDLYSDFQCSACKHFADSIEPAIVEKYVQTGKLYLVYHTYRVIGPESDDAAAAAYCAADQNKFWEYHDTLYANWTGEEVGDFTPAKLKAMAKSTAGIDATKFNQCFTSGTYKQKVTDDQTAGDAIPLSYTPSVFINGKLNEKGDYAAAIDAALAGK